MLKKVSVKEIEKIKERLEAELRSKDLSFQRKEEVESLLNHLDTWSEWRVFRERKHYKEVLKSESGI
ncbi:hypothetical protein ES702_00335 [subsurface metagenome]